MKNDKINIFKSKIEEKIKNNDFVGYNPYDLLASPLFEKISNRKLLILLTQFFKILPINFRKCFKIKKMVSPKAFGLMLSAFMIKGKNENEIPAKLYKWLIDNKSKKFEGYSIGFPFSIVISHYKSEANHPSLIITLFVMYSFIEYYLKSGNDEILQTILSFEKVIENDLPYQETDEYLYYSYNFSKLNEVYNATAKVGKFYSLFYQIYERDEFKNKIKKILNYLISKQNDDGTWYYSENVKYVDGFHTAFILEAIWEMKKLVTNNEIEEMFEKGMNNYKTNFIKTNGQPLYFHPKHKPNDVRKYFTETDIRDCAMGIILYTKFNMKEEAEKILNWTLKNMFNEKKLYFYHFKEKFWTNNIEYVRPQAWMYYAITLFNNKWRINE
ncbi:MAG: prenyltransferase/squalene oxidase repeat-containing protein [Candidatus Marinimicrobia bacterium]|nr:prenyltransferase/squalene oxidase repeat-containing protein [Candidatus Neomarinimicrobiota bacterium]